MTDVLEVIISEIGVGGDGVSQGPDGQIFVPMALEGERVKIRLGKKGRFGYKSELLEIIDESPDRIKPTCQHFGSCGGCQMQYMPDALYTEWMKESVAATLAHHGHEDTVVNEPIISPEASRRRVNLKVLKTAGGIVLGFNKRASHQLVSLKECPVTRSEITDIFKPLKKVLNDIFPPRKAGEVAITLTASGIDLLIDAPMEISLEQREALVDFANAHDIASLNWNDRGFMDPVIIRGEAVMNFAGAQVPLPPSSFIQATDEGEAALVNLVLKGVEGCRRVADLFSGIGTFTFPLAKKAQVLAVEGFKPASDACQAGINRSTGFKQIINKHRDLYRRPMTAKELKGFDAVVFDPPRAGAKEQVDALKDSDIPTLVAVSCSPNSFGRDGRILKEGGYTLDSVTPVGQFRWTPHIELVGVYKKDVSP